MTEDIQAFLSGIQALARAHPLYSTATVVLTFLGASLLNSLFKVVIEKKFGEFWKFVGSLPSRRRFAKVQKASHGRSFAVGSVSASIHVIDLNLMGYNREKCGGDVGVNCDISDFPSTLKQEFETREAIYKEQLSKGVFFSERKLALQDFIIQRGKTPFDSGFKFSFELRSYATQRAATDVFRGLSQPEIAAILESGRTRVNRAFSNTFGTSVAVLTADSKLMFAKRSRYVRANAGLWQCGIVEGSSEEDVDWVSRKASPYLTAVRGLSREIGINVVGGDLDALSLIALGLNEDYYEFNMFGVLDCSKLKKPIYAIDIQNAFRLGRSGDKFEFDEIEFVHFTPTAIAKHLKAKKEEVTNYGVVTCVLAMLRTHKEIELVKALQ